MTPEWREAIRKGAIRRWKGPNNQDQRENLRRIAKKQWNRLSQKEKNAKVASLT